MTVTYTGGREGIHAVTMAKPIGGGVSDIQHVPLDQTEMYAENGYSPLDTDGLYPHSGYCINHPVTVGDPDGIDCSPATVTPVLFNKAAVLPTATHQAPAAAGYHPPARLPDVGSSNLAILLPLIVAIVGSAMIEAGRHRRWRHRQRDEFAKRKHN